MKGQSLSRGVLLLAAAFVLAASPLGSLWSVDAQGNNLQTDVVYGEANGESLLLDVHQPPSASDVARPAVMLIHGGAGSFGERSDLADHAAGLSAAGYVVFNIHYRLFGGGKNPWPAQLDDAR